MVTMPFFRSEAHIKLITERQTRKFLKLEKESGRTSERIATNLNNVIHNLINTLNPITEEIQLRLALEDIICSIDTAVKEVTNASEYVSDY